MEGSIKRRDFLKSASVFVSSIAINNSGAMTDFLPAGAAFDLKNEFFTVLFDKKKGVFNIYRNDGKPFIAGGAAAANLSAGKHSMASDSYRHSLSSTAITDALGSGKRLAISSTDQKKKLDLQVFITLYDGSNSLTIETEARNASRKAVTLNSIETFRILKEEGAALNMPGVSKCLTNGEMYFDDGALHDFSAAGTGIRPPETKGVTLANKIVSKNHPTIHSWWNTGMFSGYDKEGIAIGYIQNDRGLGNLLFGKSGDDELSIIAESVYAPGMTLKPGKDISSNRVMITIADNPYAALENYADAAGKVNNARVGSILNGWCSWFYTLAEVSEAEVVANTAFAAKHLKPYGLEYIQIDEGFQRWHGEWEGNSRFPHGMKWLGDYIRSQGFKPGVWISPYVVSEPSEVFQQHKDWLVKRKDGSLQRVGAWPEGTEPPADENPKRYCLDITHPEAAKWLHNLVGKIANDWGYELIKIDFVAWSILAAEQYYDPTLSSAQVYRKGMEIMRKAAGDKCHILECGPGAVTTGLIDSMRIELDVNYGFADAAWNTYFLDQASSMSAAAKRYYFHKRTWMNDVDHVCLQLLNNEQSQAAATVIAMSGGNMFSGDRLIQLDDYKLDILKKITPSSGEAAVPVDLFDSDKQSAFAVKLKKPFGEWTVAAFFNASLTEAIEKTFSLDRLWLEPGKTYLAFDFWKKQFLGEVKDELKVIVQPGSVTLLSLHEDTGKPRVVSTDRHVLQGAVELENVHLDEDAKALTGVSLGPLGSAHNVYVYVPGEHPWTWGGYVLFRDYGSYSLKLVNANVIEVHVRFDKSSKVQWQLKYEEFFAALL